MTPIVYFSYKEAVMVFLEAAQNAWCDFDTINHKTAQSNQSKRVGARLRDLLSVMATRTR